MLVVGSIIAAVGLITDSSVTVVASMLVSVCIEFHRDADWNKDNNIRLTCGVGFTSDGSDSAHLVRGGGVRQAYDCHWSSVRTFLLHAQVTTTHALAPTRSPKSKPITHLTLTFTYSLTHSLTHSLARSLTYILIHLHTLFLLMLFLDSYLNSSLSEPNADRNEVIGIAITFAVREHEWYAQWCQLGHARPTPNETYPNAALADWHCLRVVHGPLFRPRRWGQQIMELRIFTLLSRAR